jgi:hypothetical protein
LFLVTNLKIASPDPALSQTAFTQSQFTTNISAAALQSQAVRNTTSCALNKGGCGSLDPETGGVPDVRRDKLRQYKQSTGGGKYSGGNSGFAPHPSLNNNNRPPRRPPVNSRGPREDAALPQQNNDIITETTATTPTMSTTASTTIVAYTITDTGSMFKTFSGSATWFPVMHLIVPQGKSAKRIHVACMMMSDTTNDSENWNNSPDTYSLRVVDSKGSAICMRSGCGNTENFQVFTLDISENVAIGLLELQAQNGSGRPILVSSAILEF